MSKKEKKRQVITIAKMGEILTARPEGMPYDEYRDRIHEQNLRLKARLKGFMVWKIKAVAGFGKSPWGALETHGTLKGAVPRLRFR